MAFVQFRGRIGVWVRDDIIMNKFAIVSRKDELSYKIEKYVMKKLIENGWIVDEQDPQLVLCIGGDGTMLYAIHQYLECKNASFLGIHTGTLGFFTDYTKEEADVCVQDILSQEPEFREVLLLKIQCDDQQPFYALNEMRIENVIRTQELEVKIDGEHFEYFRGTGMCVSTQAGSTAYNRSLKGAVLDQDLELIQLHEITGIHHHKYHSLGVPYILNRNREIEFISNNFDNALLCYDSWNISLDSVRKIVVSLGSKKIKFAKYRKVPFLERLKNLY